MSNTKNWLILIVSFLAVLSVKDYCLANEEEQQLAKKLANPVADLISIPLQVNYDQNMGPDENGSRVVMNLQPVIPISITDKWNVISRTIVPFVRLDDVVPGGGTISGLGDISQSLFFSPKEPTPHGMIWGVGPILVFPTGSTELLRSRKWSAGPSAVALKQQGIFTVGALANHSWSYAGDADRDDVNATFLQPFVSLSTKNGVTTSLSTESTYDWIDNQWVVPMNLSVSKIIRIGRLPCSVGGGVKYYSTAAPNGPEGWGARASITLILPKSAFSKN